jgi:hypothetical protein
MSFKLWSVVELGGSFSCEDFEASIELSRAKNELQNMKITHGNISRPISRDFGH